MKHKPQRFLFRGRLETVPNIAKELGIKPHSVRDRIRKGIPLDQKAGPQPSMEYKGRLVSFRELSEMCGINEQTLRYRIFTKNMTIDEAMTAPVARHRGYHKNTHSNVWNDEQKILQAWNKGELTIGEVMEVTGYDQKTVAAVLPVRELEADEIKAKREVLRKYGY